MDEIDTLYGIICASYMNIVVYLIVKLFVPSNKLTAEGEGSGTGVGPGLGSGI